MASRLGDAVTALVCATLAGSTVARTTARRCCDQVTSTCIVRTGVAHTRAASTIGVEAAAGVVSDQSTRTSIVPGNFRNVLSGRTVVGVIARIPVVAERNGIEFGKIHVFEIGAAH